MPHQCTNCGHTFPDGSKEMLSGCPECGGNKFQFKPAGSNADSVADDAADANRYVREVCEGKDADRVVKSKSMTSEEIEVNEALEAEGVEVVETDLGEWVLQLADEAPSHIVAPAIHKSRESIAELFAERFDPEDPPETAEELTMFARERLGEPTENGRRHLGWHLPTVAITATIDRELLNATFELAAAGERQVSA